MNKILEKPIKKGFKLNGELCISGKCYKDVEGVYYAEPLGKNMVMVNIIFNFNLDNTLEEWENTDFINQYVGYKNKSYMGLLNLCHYILDKKYLGTEPSVSNSRPLGLDMMTKVRRGHGEVSCSYRAEFSPEDLGSL